MTDLYRLYKEIYVWQSKWISLPRNQGIRSGLKRYFDLLESVCEDIQLFNEPQHIFNLNGTGLNLTI